MSYTPEELLKLASNYDNVATRALVVTAAKKEKKKMDPKAKVRNRGTVCVPAEQAKDKKDHFPINDEGQARNALARVQQLSSAPWYKGSLEGLKALVARKVKAKYPGINVGGKDSKKKKASEYYDALLNKFAQQVSYGVGLSAADQSKLFGLIKSLNAKDPALSNELNNAFAVLSGHRAEENGVSFFVPENVQQFLPVLDKVKVELNQADPNGAEFQTAVVLYDLFKRMSVASNPAHAGGGGRGSKFPAIDTTFQTMLGVNPDGSLGPQTQSALEMYKKSIGLPYGADEATRRTDSNKNNQQAFESLKQRPEYKTKSKMAYDDTNDVYKAPTGGIVRDNPF